MDNDNFIVVLLVVVILLSVVTIGVTLGLNLENVFSKPVNPEGYVDVNHANVGLEIAQTFRNTGGLG